VGVRRVTEPTAKFSCEIAVVAKPQAKRMALISVGATCYSFYRALHFPLADASPSIFRPANGIENPDSCLIDKIVSEIIGGFLNLLEAYAAVDLPCSRKFFWSSSTTVAHIARN